MRPIRTPDRSTRNKIAALAECEERSVRHYFESPERLRGPYRIAIRLALAEVGLPDPHAPAAGAQS